MMIGYDSGRALRAFATFEALGLAFCTISLETVLADQQHKPSRPVEADQQIASLLADIENALAQSQTIPPEVSNMLISAGGLLTSASPEGRRLLKSFPARLKKNADEARDPQEKRYRTAFANAAASYIDTLDMTMSNQSPASSSPTHVMQEDEVTTTPLSELPKPPSVASPTHVMQESKVTAPAQPDLSNPPMMAPLVQRTLLDRGDAMLGLGNVSAARMLYQRAADAGVGVAALKLAETYDPAFLASRNLRGIKSDPVAAEVWYRKADALGEAGAIERLKSLTGRGLTNSATH
jgi:hypothetical protein